MPSLSKYTQWKVIGGYSLLFLLSILAAVLIYKQITKLIVNEENSDNPNRKLFIIGNTITGLYESEGLGNAFVQTGSRSYFLKYRDLIEEVESNIDSLRDLTTRLDQILRLDTIDDLLDQKIRNLQDIVRVKQSFVPDDFYNKAIASIESGRDSVGYFFPRPSPIPYSKFRFLIILLSIRSTGKQPYKIRTVSFIF